MREIMPVVLSDPTREVFQTMLFSKIVPNCKKLGLLDRNDKWLRRRFEEMNVIQFEDWADTGEEYESMSLEAVQQDTEEATDEVESAGAAAS